MENVGYRTIGVASTFSPRFVQVLAEAKKMRERFGADLHLIYVGDETEETTLKFREVFGRLQLPLDSTVHYEKGDPADSILRALTNQKIDLLVAGALEKPVVLHPFLGNVARRLVREAPCSIMLFIKPELEPTPLRRIVFIADDGYSDQSRSALQRTLQLAAAENSERVYVIRVMTTFDEARASLGDRASTAEKKGPDAHEAALEEFVLSAGHTDAPVEVRCIRGNTGFAASDFVQSVEADLLVVSTPPSGAQGAVALPSNIAWLTDVIPCNLWIVR